MVEMLKRSYVYTRSTAEEIDILIKRWEGLVCRGRSTWESIVKAGSVEATTLDELETFEQDMLHGCKVPMEPSLRDHRNSLRSDSRERDGLRTSFTITI
jgi:hypothetical protein